MSAAVLFSLTAAALTAVCSVPQCHWALRQTAGLSVAAWLQGFALGLIWATYGLATQQWVLLVSEGAFACGSLAIVHGCFPGVEPQFAPLPAPSWWRAPSPCSERVRACWQRRWHR